jgi:hypothetical protein
VFTYFTLSLRSKPLENVACGDGSDAPLAAGWRRVFGRSPWWLEVNVFVGPGLPKCQVQPMPKSDSSLRSE